MDPYLKQYFIKLVSEVSQKETESNLAFYAFIALWKDDEHEKSLF